MKAPREIQEVDAFLSLLALDEAADQFLGRASRTRKWKRLTPLEERMTEVMAVFFLIQVRDFLGQVGQKPSVFRLVEALSEPWERMWTQTEIDSITVVQAPLDSIYTDALAAGTQVALATWATGFSFALDNPRATLWLADASATMIKGVNDTTREEIRAMLAEGRVDGVSYDVMARRLVDRFAWWGTPQPQQHIKSRAHLIAVTEVGDAYEQGNRQVALAMQDAGLRMVKRHMTVADRRVDPICLAAQDQGWVPLDRVFFQGATQAPLHPACRCTTEYQRAQRTD